MRGARAGFTLVEMMLAGAITMLMTLALLEGLIVSARISRENSELLAADALIAKSSEIAFQKEAALPARHKLTGTLFFSGGMLVLLLLL